MRVVAEAPEGLGFGSPALALSRLYRPDQTGTMRDEVGFVVEIPGRPVVLELGQTQRSDRRLGPARDLMAARREEEGIRFNTERMLASIDTHQLDGMEPTNQRMLPLTLREASAARVPQAVDQVAGYVTAMFSERELSSMARFAHSEAESAVCSAQRAMLIDGGPDELLPLVAEVAARAWPAGRLLRVLRPAAASVCTEPRRRQDQGPGPDRWGHRSAVQRSRRKSGR